MKAIWLILIFAQFALCMLIPEDTELLDGFLPVSIAEQPNDEYFEADSLNADTLLHSIRNKRGAGYDVQESDGLPSHFRPNSVNGFTSIHVEKKEHLRDYEPKHKPDDDLEHRLEEAERGREHEFEHRRREHEPIPLLENHHERTSFRWLQNILRKKFPEEEAFAGNHLSLLMKRRRRSADDENKKSNDENEKNKKSNAEKLPKASKFVSTSNGFSSKERSTPSAAALVSKWTRTPFEYSKIQLEEDSLAMDTSSSAINEGIKARTPRVNFVTQQKKSMDHNDDSKSSGTKSEFYKSPPLLHNSKEIPSDRDRYLEPSRVESKPSSYPEYNYNRDRDMNDNRYIDGFLYSSASRPYYNPMLEYRNAPPYDMYMRRPPYDYFSPHYDLPDYVDYPPPYTNDIDNRYYNMRTTDMMPPPPPVSSTSSASSRRRIIYYANLPDVVRSPPSVDLRYRSYDRFDPYYDYFNYYDAPMMSGAYHRPMKQPIDREPMPRDYIMSKPLKENQNEMISNPVKEKRYNRRPREYDFQ